MKKTMITTATVAALVLSAGMSMAGPLGGNGKLAFTQDVRSSVSQTLKQTDGMANTHQTYTVTSSSPSTQLPNVVVIDIHDGANSSVIIGKADDMIHEYSWMFGRFDLDAR